jgi:hypothetical protein
MGYAEDSDYKPKPKKTALVGKTDAKQKAYYTKQRKDAEAGEKKGNIAATRTAAKIHQKTGRKLTGAEGDLTLKPGASEGEQMGNLTAVLGGAGDLGGVVMRGLSRVAEDMASHAAMRLPSGEARSSLGPAMKRMKLGSGNSTRGEMSMAKPKTVEARTGGPRKVSGSERKALGSGKAGAKPMKRVSSPKKAVAKVKGRNAHSQAKDVVEGAAIKAMRGGKKIPKKFGGVDFS